MNIHKRTRLTLLDRQEIWRLYQTRLWKVVQLAEHFHISRPTIYDVLKRARLQEFTPRSSTNQRFKTLQYGLKRLAKVEQTIQERLKREAKRYNKSYPGELVHLDTKRLPLLKGQSANKPREYLFVAIDDFSGEFFPDKTQYSAACFLIATVAQCPYQIDCTYSDNGTEFKGTDDHAFVKACRQHGIGQKFTRINRPQTNGKAERVIRTLMDMWHNKFCFKDTADRRIQLVRFINFYNTVKPHKSLYNATPYEILNAYFNQPLCKQP
ncbi:MAG: transposase family protein [Gammaproteobacteria bacterium]|nr:MAG: transposase family protein [Gammaproteobacteria bacterium]